LKKLINIVKQEIRLLTLQLRSLNSVLKVIGGQPQSNGAVAVKRKYKKRKKKGMSDATKKALAEGRKMYFAKKKKRKKMSVAARNKLSRAMRKSWKKRK